MSVWLEHSSCKVISSSFVFVYYVESAANRPKLVLEKRSVEVPLHQQVQTSRNASIFGTGRPRPPSPDKEEDAKSSTEKMTSPPISPHAVDTHLAGDVENMHLGPPGPRRHESGGSGDAVGVSTYSKTRAAERGHRSESGGGGDGEYAEGEQHEGGAPADYEDDGAPPGDEEGGGFTFQHQDA